MKNNRKILVIEDNITMQKMFKKLLSPYGEIIQAFNLKEAADKFTEEKDITHIIVDGRLGKSLPNEKPNITDELVVEMRKTFKGPMIAVSGDITHNEKLRLLGCDHSIIKEDSVFYIMELLDKEL
ncbi:MAG: response regulator [Candidatus Falkowbacteria bacterium]